MYPKFEKFDLPVWALSYMINADPSGLEDGEIKMIDAWMERRGIAWACTPEEDDGPIHFDPCPVFGLGADVVPCYCAMMA